MEKILIMTLGLILIFSGCSAPNVGSERAKELCVSKCREILKNHQNLSDGPCLSNEIIKDWVCDVAHYPRIEKDDFPQNQCENFRNGAAHHFVEVDSECNLIRVY